jgi:hypothetical protein
VKSASTEVDRSAFYALRPGGWRDLVTVLHPPYTAWNLATVALGAAVAPTLHAWRLGATIGAFFLAVGVSAHALDELHGRPLQTELSKRTLVVLATIGLAGAVAIGVVTAIVVSPLLIPLIVFGGLFVPAYNLELAGGRFHNDFWLAVGWGGFSAFTGYFVNALTVRPAGLLVSAACCFFLLAQRRLSTPVRELRRRTVEVSGQQRLSDGTVIELTRERLVAPLDGALSVLWIAFVLLATGLVVFRLSG